MGKKRTAEDVIINKLQRPTKTSISTLSQFNSFFVRERQVETRGRVSKKGSLLIDKTGFIEEYESNLEKRILSLLDVSDNVCSIKTQCIVLDYYYWGKDRVYYPDIVFLSSNGHIGVIEVKDSISMFKSKTTKKYEALKEYCETNGFFYAMLNDYDDYEGIKNMLIKEDLELYLTNQLNIKKSVSWASIKDICKLKCWTIQDVLCLVHNNSWKIKSPKSRVWAFSIQK